MAISIIGGVGGISVETDPLALKLTGGTLSGKLSCSAVSGVSGINIGIGGNDTSSNTAGDLWIATNGASLNFRDGTGAWRQCLSTSSAGSITANTATTPALRVTQTGAAPALLVEDSTNPDSTPFLINSSGQVVIGSLNAANASVGLTVINGVNISAGANNSIQLTGNLDLSSQPTFSNTTSISLDYPNELQLVINGNTVYIPFRT